MAAMRIHDWTRVDAGVWHDFHIEWALAVKHALNDGLLPKGFYAQAERQASRYEADVLTLEQFSPNGGSSLDGSPDDGGVATAVAPPRLSVERRADPAAAAYANKRRTIAVRHSSGDRTVALIEIVSPGNKDRATAVDAFVNKAAAATEAGINLVVLDLFPPRRADGPLGLVGRVAEAAGFEPLSAAEGKPLWVAGLDAGPQRVLYAEPLAVDDTPPDVPLFLSPGRYVDVPLAATYAAAWRETPERWRAVVEGTEA